MSGRLSSATEQAIALVAAGTHSISAAARECGLAISTVRRALRRQGEPPRKGGPPMGVQPTLAGEISLGDSDEWQ